MKRIKLFENFKESEFVLSIKDCFSDLIDDGKVEIEIPEAFGLDEDEVIVSVLIESITTNINDFFKCKEDEFLIIRDVKLALERIVEIFNIDYDIDFELEFGEKYYQLFLIFTPAKGDKCQVITKDFDCKNVTSQWQREDDIF